MSQTANPNSGLLAIYDLAVSPASFDILSYLVEAERVRRERSLPAITVMIVPNAADGARLFDLHTLAHDKWRLTNILVPSCGLLPTVHGLTLANSRAEAAAFMASWPGAVFPESYSVEQPKAHHNTAWPIIAAHQGVNQQCLRASDQARRYARQWIEARAGGRKSVVLTLREATYTPKRNSRVGEWLRFAELLSDAGYFPIVIRDTDRALDLDPAFAGIAVCPEAAFNLDLRLGLYEECHIAAFVSNGPSTPCYFDRDVRYLYFVTGEYREDDPPGFYQVGIGDGTTPPFANSYQRWIWCDQDADRFMAELVDLDRAMEARRADGTYEAGLHQIAANREPFLTIADRLETWSKRKGGGFTEWELVAYCLERTPEVASGHIPTIRRLAYCYLRLQRYDDAFAFLSEILAREPSVENFLALGGIYKALDRWDEAREIYERVAERVDRNDADILELLAISYFHCGRFEEGLACFRENTVKFPNEARWMALGLAYEALDRWSEARDVYRSALDKWKTPLLEFRFHRALAETGDGVRAISFFWGLIDAGILVPAIYVELGALYERMGDSGNALEVYRLAIQRGLGGLSGHDIAARYAALVAQTRLAESVSLAMNGTR